MTTYTVDHIVSRIRNSSPFFDMNLQFQFNFTNDEIENFVTPLLSVFIETVVSDRSVAPEDIDMMKLDFEQIDAFYGHDYLTFEDAMEMLLSDNLIQGWPFDDSIVDDCRINAQIVLLNDLKNYFIQTINESFPADIFDRIEASRH